MYDTFVFTFKIYLEHIAQTFIFFLVLLMQYVFIKGHLYGVNCRTAHCITCVCVCVIVTLQET